MIEGIEDVKKNINAIYKRKINASHALCLWYAGKALATFRRFQGFNSFWNNQTNTAYNGVYTDEISTGNVIGWFISHSVEYGVYLELANDRKHEALWPVVRDMYSEFELDLHKIWE